MEKHSKRFLSALLAVIMVVSMVPIYSFTVSAVPKTYTTGDIIEYGAYPQTKVTNLNLITILNGCTLSSDNTVIYGGAKYKRVYFTDYRAYYNYGPAEAEHSYQDDNGYFINTVYWFKFEPIQWRVLSNIDNELFVMSEKLIDAQVYNLTFSNVTWEICSMRSWLNNDFYNMAFTLQEQMRIKTSAVINEDNLWFACDGGNDTSDKLFLLSYSQSMNNAYGLPGNRQAQGTDFAKCNGLATTFIRSLVNGNSNWWLRSPGVTPDFAGFIDSWGDIYRGGEGRVYWTYDGVRPAFRINLSSSVLTSSESWGCVIDYLNGYIYGLDKGITSLDSYVDIKTG